MTSACDYLREYRARARGGYVHGMVAPWRHENPLVRALYWKQRKWMWATELKKAAKPSPESDIAFDGWAKAHLGWQCIIRDAWTTRAMSRGTIPAKQREPEAA